MSNKLIDLNALSEYKDYSDLKYQDKLTAGDNITISNNIISVSPTFVNVELEAGSVPSGSITSLGNITLAPGNYIISYRCDFATNTSGYRQCGFSPNTTDMTGFGRAWGDTRNATGSVPTSTCVDGVFDVPAAEYPNGRTFYFLAYQTSGSSLTATPTCNYFKF